jgi:hypothetical protein
MRTTGRVIALHAWIHAVGPTLVGVLVLIQVLHRALGGADLRAYADHTISDSRNG